MSSGPNEIIEFGKGDDDAIVVEFIEWAFLEIFLGERGF
jgi:hypothetical protein